MQVSDLNGRRTKGIALEVYREMTADKALYVQRNIVTRSHNVYTSAAILRA